MKRSKKQAPPLPRNLTAAEYQAECEAELMRVGDRIARDAGRFYVGRVLHHLAGIVDDDSMSPIERLELVRSLVDSCGLRVADREVQVA